MKWWDWMPWSSFFECCVLNQCFPLSSFTIKRLFSSSSLSAIRVVLSELVIFHLAILIPACESSSLTFHMIYFAYKLNKYTALIYSFPNLELVCCFMSDSNCCFLVCLQVSQEAGQVVWNSHLFKNFPQFVVFHTVKGFSIATEEVDVFLKFPCFLYDPMDTGNLVSGSSACISGSSQFTYCWSLV